MINKRRIIHFTFVILLGLLMFIFAGIDDSPGGQLLGFIIVIFGVIGIIKNRKKKPNSSSEKL